MDDSASRMGEREATIRGSTTAREKLGYVVCEECTVGGMDIVTWQVVEALTSDRMNRISEL